MKISFIKTELEPAGTRGDEKSDKRKGLYFSLMLLLILFNYSYRYIFQYNDETSSAFVYTDTPLPFKIAKYVILLILLVLMLINERGIVLEKRNWSIKLPALFLLVQSALYGILIRDDKILVFAMLLCPLFVYPNRGLPKEQTVEKILDFFWYYTTIYEIIQIVLFYTTGRVPALAFPHRGTLMAVRYGGAFDDPNGYATVLIFYVFWFLLQKPGLKSITRLVITLLMLVFTWSGTGYIAVLATALLFFLFRIRDKLVVRRFLIIGGACAAAALLIFLIKPDLYSSVFHYLVNGKGGSIDGHLKSWNVSMLDAGTWLGIHPVRATWGEVGYVRLLEIGGIPSVLCFLVCSGFGLVKINRRITAGSAESKPFLYGVLAYMVGFLVTMLNFPTVVNFDVMGLYTVCLILAMIPDTSKSVRFSGQ